MALTDMLERHRKPPRAANLVVFMVDEASVRRASQMLTQSGVTDFHAEVGTVDDLVEYLERTEQTPARLIVDISGLKDPFKALDRLADACDPSVTVFAVGDTNDVTLYRDLLRAGISDYRYKPLTDDALRGWMDEDGDYTIRRGRSGKVVAMAGARGGIGVSTHAVHLARELSSASASRKVVVVDLDLYGGASTTLLGMPPNRGMPEALKSLDALDGPFLERILTTQDGRLFSLGLNQGLEASFSPVPGAMAELLDRLSQHFHYVIVDLPDYGGRVADEVYSRATSIGLLCDSSVHSGRVVAAMLAHIRATPEAPPVYVVINAVRPTSGRVDAEHFGQAIGQPIALSVPYDGRFAAVAEDLGEPLPAESLLGQCVSRIVKLMTGESIDEGEGSWFQRLLRRK